MSTTEIALSESPVAKPLALTAQDKAEWVKRFRESGQSLRSFSAQHALPLMSLWRWARKQRLEVEGLSPGLVPSSEPQFAEIKWEPCLARGGEWVAELSLPGGRVLRLSKEVPPAMLEQLLRVC